ncbi:MAG: LCP family protein [Eubacteriales bacterium]|nr:LCP family protein [Eubacteriales bacterium]
MKKVIVILSVVLVLFGVLGAGFLLVNSAEKEELAEIAEVSGKTVHVSPTPEQLPGSQNGAKSVQGFDDVINILLVGVDNSTAGGLDDRGNSDGMLLVSLNPDTEEIVFTSFLRDIRVRVNDAYYDKLTMVFHSGGIELLEKTYKENFNLDIDYYAIFNYLDVISIVDSVGGVDVELSEEEIYFMEGKIRNLSSLSNTPYSENELTTDQAGLLTLNGVQTAAYMRIRPAEGYYDFGRTERARTVVSEIIRKVYALSAQDMLQFASVLFEKIETDIPVDVMMAFAANAEEIKAYQQVMDRIPIDDAYSSLDNGSGFYIVPDFEVNSQHLYESIYEGKH